MEKRKGTLGLEMFKDSRIRQKILEGTLKVGSQIWVYHDRVTDPVNTVARFHP